MNDTTEKAQDKLIASMTKSQETTAGVSSKKYTVSHKRSDNTDLQGENSNGKNTKNAMSYEMRNSFNGHLRWPD